MKTRNLKLLIPLLALTVMVTNCSKDDDPTGPGSPVPADLNSYMQSLPSWSTFSPQQADNDAPNGDSYTETENVDGTDYTCEITPYSITRTPEQIATLNPDVEILWPGVLLQGSGHLNGIGALAELPIRQRAPLTLSIDLLTSENTQTVDNPDLASVNQAVGELIQAAQDAGHSAGSSLFYTEKSMHSVSQVSLSMGLSASYMSASIEAKLEASSTREKNSLTAYFAQQMFTVSTVLPQTPDEFFSDEFTQERLQEQVELGRMGTDNLPVFISSVVYGRVLMFSCTSSSSVDSIRAALSAAYDEANVGGEVDSRYLSILQQAEINVVAVGGDEENARALIRSGNLSEYFTSETPLTTARPISYTVRNLADNVIAIVSETTEYNIKQCASEPTGAEYDIHLYEMKASPVGADVFNPLDPLDHLQAEVYYRIRVEDVLNGTQDLGFWEWNFICPAALMLWENERKTVVDNLHTNCQSFDTTAKRVRIHYDGRDYIKIFGEVWDFDDDSPDDRIYHKTVRFEYPGTPVPTNPNYVITGPNENNTVIKLYFRFEKVRNLYD